MILMGGNCQECPFEPVGGGLGVVRGDGGDTNLYCHAYNDPLNATDVTGLNPVTDYGTGKAQDWGWDHFTQG